MFFCELFFWSMECDLNTIFHRVKSLLFDGVCLIADVGALGHKFGCVCKNL